MPSQLSLMSRLSARSDVSPRLRVFLNSKGILALIPTPYDQNRVAL